MRLTTLLILCGALCGGLSLGACSAQRSDLLGDGRSGGHKVAPTGNTAPLGEESDCVEGSLEGETCRKIDPQAVQ